MSTRTSAELKSLTKALEKRRKAGRANFGTIDLLPSGRLRARYVGPDEIRYNAPHTFDALQDADAYLISVRQEIQRGTWLSPIERRRAEHVAKIAGTTANALFADYIDEGDLKPRTQALYRYQWERLIEDTIGQRSIADLTPTDVARWRSHLPPAKRQREQAEDLLRAVMNLALERRLIDFNPAARRRRKRKGQASRAKARDTVLLTAAEVQALAGAMPARHAFAVLISAWCGLRQGEMLALRRGHLHIDRDDHRKITNAIVFVERSVVRAKDAAGVRRTIEGDPKSDTSIRRVAVPPHIWDALDLHLERWAMAGDDGLLFPNSTGGFLAPSTLYGEQPGTKRASSRRKSPSKGSGFYKARASIGKANLTWHALRHHAVTRAVYAGATSAELLERYGHSSTAISARYQHADHGRDIEIARKMAELAKEVAA